MKFSTLSLAAAALTIASFVHAADESKFAPQPMSMKSRGEVRAEAVGTQVPGELGYFMFNGQKMDMSKLTREEVRAMIHALDGRARYLDQVGGM